MKIYVAFYRGKGSFINSIVRWWTKSEFSHAELVLPDKVTWMGISPFIKSQVCRRIVLDVNREDWKFVSVDITQEQLDIILDFYKETRGKGYDWVGMLLSQFLPWRIKTKNRWYCSEWISYALRISCALDWKVLRLYERKELSPATLHSIMMKNKIILP